MHTSALTQVFVLIHVYIDWCHGCFYFNGSCSSCHSNLALQMENISSKTGKQLLSLKQLHMYTHRAGSGYSRPLAACAHASSIGM